MPNSVQVQPIQYEETPINPLLVFNKIKKFLDKFDNWENPHKFIIEEYFPASKADLSKSNTYKLDNLVIETIENGIVYFTDIEGILEEKMYNNSPTQLQAIILEKVISADINDHYKCITITFETGYIRINY